MEINFNVFLYIFINNNVNKIFNNEKNEKNEILRNFPEIFFYIPVEIYFSHPYLVHVNFRIVYGVVRCRCFDRCFRFLRNGIRCG